MSFASALASQSLAGIPLDELDYEKPLHFGAVAALVVAPLSLVFFNFVENLSVPAKLLFDLVVGGPVLNVGFVAALGFAVRAVAGVDRRDGVVGAPVLGRAGPQSVEHKVAACRRRSRWARWHPVTVKYGPPVVAVAAAGAVLGPLVRAVVSFVWGIILAVVLCAGFRHPGWQPRFE